jgi:L-alanine-DL-glutamate epimerase-like enolase superfamily enzyme
MNCRYFTFLLPVGANEAGMRAGITLESDGTVSGPHAPGLGVDVDKDATDARTVARA